MRARWRRHSTPTAAHRCGGCGRHECGPVLSGGAQVVAAHQGPLPGSCRVNVDPDPRCFFGGEGGRTCAAFHEEKDINETTEGTWEDVGPAGASAAALNGPCRINVAKNGSVRIVLRGDVMTALGWSKSTTLRLRVSGPGEEGRLLLSAGGPLGLQTNARSKGTHWLRPEPWWWLNNDEKARFACSYEVQGDGSLLITPPGDAVRGDGGDEDDADDAGGGEDA